MWMTPEQEEAERRRIEGDVVAYLGPHWLKKRVDTEVLSAIQYDAERFLRLHKLDEHWNVEVTLADLQQTLGVVVWRRRL